MSTTSVDPSIQVHLAALCYILHYAFVDNLTSCSVGNFELVSQKIIRVIFLLL